MSNLVPEKWREALEQVQEKVGSYLNNLVPTRKNEHSLEAMTADTVPVFMHRGGPLVDMHETSDGLVVRAEVPGLKREELKIELVDRRLTISGEKKVVREEKGGDGRYLSECRYGSFSRTVQLPYPIDDQTMSADLKHGVLTIRLKRPEKELGARRKIPVS
jgi:HSP20 family protein